MSILLQIVPGWCETNPTWKEFATLVDRWKGGEAPNQADTLFDALNASATPPDGYDMQIIHKIFRLSQIHQESGHWDRAEFLAIKAFLWLEKTFGPDNMVLINPLMELSAIWLGKGEETRAVQALHRGLRIVEKEYPDSAIFAAGIHQRLATIHRQVGREDLANVHEKKLAEVWKQTVEPNSIAEVILKKDDIVRLWQEKHKTEAAEATAKVLDILTKTPGPYQGTRITLMLALAQHSADMPDTEKANLLLNSLAIAEQLHGEHNPGLIPFMTELAHVYQKQGKMNLAQPLLLRSLELAEKFFKPNHSKIAQIYFNLGENSRLGNQDEEAMSFYHHATAILRGHAPSQNAFLAQILSTQTIVYKKMGKLVQAEQTQMECLTLLAGQTDVQTDTLHQAREEHKELIAMLRRQAGTVHDYESLDPKTLVTLLQRGLTQTGVDPGPADGYPGTKTIQSIHVFEKRIGLPESQTINNKTIIGVLEHLPP
ncbi:MAG: pilus assembly protein PilF [Magnetococcales bacterium]|nr:pilus assembly protein PilF [Magnetococcales bacterium]HIJ83163.1 tetratricopeptide repeat protein [Magnetococcales bacterium]